MNGIPEDSSVDRRLHPRAKVLWTGSLESGNRSMDCVLLNIGARGAMGRSVGVLARGRVSLQSFHFGRLAAEIVWQEGNAFGLRFKASPAEVRNAIGWQLPELRLA